MKKIYYLIFARQDTCFGGLRYIESKILKKSSDISELQKILHEEYLEALNYECVVEINGTERDWDWYDNYDEYYDDDEYDDDEYDEYYDDNEYDDDCSVQGWPDKPEECEDELTYILAEGDDVTHFLYRIISDDDING